MPKSRKPRAKRLEGNGHFLTRKDEAVVWFQREGFDPSEFITLLHSEKELDQARGELSQLNEYCKQEVQKVVHDHHKDFLEASRDIQELETLVDELRNYVSGSAAVVANLVDLPTLPKQVLPPLVLTGVAPHGQPDASTAWEGISALQAELMQDLQVAVAEKDYALARALLGAGRDMIAVVDRDAAHLLSQAKDGIPAWRYAFEGALAAQKAVLIDDLQRQLAQINSSTLERRQAAQNLSLLVGPSQATQTLLRCHTLQIRATQQHLLKQHSAAGGDPDGVEYAGRLAQRTFLAVGAAAEDVRAVFPGATLGGGTPRSAASASAPDAAAAAPEPADEAVTGIAAVLPTVSALVVQWAADEARHCANLLCRHALAPFVATGMAVGALLCVGLALVFCVALEASHGLALRMTFQEELWPLVEAIVRRHLQRLREEAASAASVDTTNAALQAVAGAVAPAAAAAPDGRGDGAVRPAGAPELGANGAGNLEGLPALFPRPNAPTVAAAPAGLTSLPMLLPEVRALAEGLAPLASTQAAALLRQGVAAAFSAVCEKVHGSLARLTTNSGAAGRDAGAYGAQLASYLVKAERQLRLFAESDVQMALEPLSSITGPVAPPELLLPSLSPLAQLLSSLPPPAPETAPAAPEPLSQSLLQQQPSGLLDRIRAELEAEQEGRQRGREGLQAREAQPALPTAAAATAPAADVDKAPPPPPEAGAGSDVPSAKPNSSKQPQIAAQATGVGFERLGLERSAPEPRAAAGDLPGQLETKRHRSKPSARQPAPDEVSAGDEAYVVHQPAVGVDVDVGPERARSRGRRQLAPVPSQRSHEAEDVQPYEEDAADALRRAGTRRRRRVSADPDLPAPTEIEPFDGGGLAESSAVQRRPRPGKSRVEFEEVGAGQAVPRSGQPDGSAGADGLRPAHIDGGAGGRRARTETPDRVAAPAAVRSQATGMDQQRHPVQEAVEARPAGVAAGQRPGASPEPQPRLRRPLAATRPLSPTDSDESPSVPLRRRRARARDDDQPLAAQQEGLKQADPGKQPASASGSPLPLADEEVPPQPPMRKAQPPERLGREPNARPEPPGSSGNAAEQAASPHALRRQERASRIEGSARQPAEQPGARPRPGAGPPYDDDSAAREEDPLALRRQERARARSERAGVRHGVSEDDDAKPEGVSRPLGRRFGSVEDLRGMGVRPARRPGTGGVSPAGARGGGSSVAGRAEAGPAEAAEPVAGPRRGGGRTPPAEEDEDRGAAIRKPDIRSHAAPDSAAAAGALVGPKAVSGDGTAAQRKPNRFGVVLSDDDEDTPVPAAIRRRGAPDGAAPTGARTSARAASGDGAPAERKPNRFGVVLSDDDGDAPVPARRFRRSIAPVTSATPPDTDAASGRRSEEPTAPRVSVPKADAVQERRGGLAGPLKPGSTQVLERGQGLPSPQGSGNDGAGESEQPPVPARRRRTVANPSTEREGHALPVSNHTSLHAAGKASGGVPDAGTALPVADGAAVRIGEDPVDATRKPLTARERLAARMAAKEASGGHSR